MDKQRDDDAIARTKKILNMVDGYFYNQTADTRSELRKTLMDYFTSDQAPLLARIAELEMQIADFNRRCEAGYSQLDYLDAVERVTEQDKKLAAQQLQIQELREAIQRMLGINYDAARNTLARIGNEALARPFDTSALDAYRDEAEIAGVLKAAARAHEGRDNGRAHRFELSGQELEDFAEELRRMKKGE